MECRWQFGQYEESALPILGVAATVLIMLGIVLGPLAFGATQVWAYCSLQIIVCLAAAISLLSSSSHTRLLPLVAAVLGIGSLQLIPLSDWLLERGSPMAMESRQAVLPLVGDDALRCISLSPGATVASMRQTLILLITAGLVASLAQHRALRLALAWSMAFVAVVVLVLAIVCASGDRYVALGVHDMTGPLRAWKNPLLSPLHGSGFGRPDLVRVGVVSYFQDAPVVGDVTGPYISSNQFSGCMGLTMPVLFGLSLALQSRSRWRWVWRVAGLLMMLAAIGAVAWVRSWGGLVSLLAALATMTWLLAVNRRAGAVSRVLAVSFTVAGLIAMAVLFDWPGSEQLTDRIPLPIRDRINEAQASVHGRCEVWRSCVEMFLGSPLAGIGMGAFGQVRPVVEQNMGLIHFAHNDYAQMLAETGLAGILVSLAAAGYALRRMHANWLEAAGTNDRGLAIGLFGAITAIAVHSLVDYNLRVPANGFLFAVVAGLALGSAAPERMRSMAGPLPNDRRQSGGLRLAIGLLLLVCCLGATRDIACDRMTSPLRHAVVAQRVDGISPSRKRQLLLDAVPPAYRAAAWAPWDSAVAENLGQAFLHLSDGQPSAELDASRYWFSQALRLAPANAGLRWPLQDLSAVIAAPPD